MGQSRSERVVEIRGSLYHRAVISSLLATTVSSENRSTKAVDSSSYRGSISGRYIKGRLSRLLGRKGLCARV